MANLKIPLGGAATIQADWDHAPDPTATWTTSNAGVVSLSTAGPSATNTLTGVAVGTAIITLAHGVCQIQVAYDVVDEGNQACAGISVTT